jgi:hypothetical protein
LLRRQSNQFTAKDAKDAKDAKEGLELQRYPIELVPINFSVIHHKFFPSPSVPLPEGEGSNKPFSLREKGGDEGNAFA